MTRRMPQAAKAHPLHQDQAHLHLIRLQARAVLLVQRRTLSPSSLPLRGRELCTSLEQVATTQLVRLQLQRRHGYLKATHEMVVTTS